MEEINAWGAYEIAATQNARSLGEYARRSSHGKKRTTNPSENNNAAPRIQSSQLDQNIKNLRHDSQPDNSSLRRTDDAPSPSKNLFGNEAGELKASTTGTSSRIIDDPEIQEEWSNIRDLARDLFQVYFTTDDSYADVEKMNHIKCKFHSLFLGTMPWLTQYIQKLDLPRPVVETLLFIEASFRGIGQVYFQNNPLSGLVILVAMVVQSSRVAIHGVIALFAGNLAGIFMGFDKCLVSCGLFGYNSFLVGLAMATFHRTADNNGFSWQIIVGSVIFAYFSSILFILLGKLLGPYKTPPFTFPFNFATLTFLLATSNELHKGDNSVINNGGSISAQDFLAGSVRGLGQVFLANNIISGVLVLVAIGICSRISALSAFLGSVIGAGVAVLAGNSVEAIENGMFGFNPSLTFTAMLMFYVPSLGSFSVGIMASVVTVFVQGACETVMRPYGLPFMTLPFCFSALSYIAIQGTTSNVISVPLSSMTTPEDHLKRVRRLSDGFQLLCGALHSSYGPSKNTLILGSVSGKIDKKVEVILEKYDEEIIGGKRKNFCRMLLQGLLFRKPRTKNHTKSSSFRLSFALRNPAFEDNEKDSYASIFHHIDSPTNYTIIKRQFKEFLNTVGFVDEAGLDFACKSFELIDLDGSGDIDLEEFIVFAKISRHMAVIRRLIVKFFNFVDIRGDRSVSIIDLESARSYLGLSSLSHDDIVSLKDFCDDDDKLEFSKIVNFVTIFKLESIIKSYKSKREGGESLDKSIHSALTEI